MSSRPLPESSNGIHCPDCQAVGHKDHDEDDQDTESDDLVLATSPVQNITHPSANKLFEDKHDGYTKGRTPDAGDTTNDRHYDQLQ